MTLVVLSLVATVGIMLLLIRYSSWWIFCNIMIFLMFVISTYLFYYGN